uniref:Uncharacterized protein n=1 Tax=Medicago truncatula TaxID=3880 RepID=I3S5J6_MEDTR|nr:unknown [Medicago truncatula]
MFCYNTKGKSTRAVLFMRGVAVLYGMRNSYSEWNTLDQETNTSSILKSWTRMFFSSDDFVGQAVIYVKDLLAEGAENGSAELRPRKYSVVRADNSYCGELEVGITYTRKENEYTDDDIGGWRDSEY